jgi:hypothetical protein
MYLGCPKLIPGTIYGAIMEFKLNFNDPYTIKFANNICLPKLLIRFQDSISPQQNIPPKDPSFSQHKEILMRKFVCLFVFFFWGGFFGGNFNVPKNNIICAQAAQFFGKKSSKTQEPSVL